MPQNTNVKKGFKLKKKTLTTDVWSELDGRKLHPPFGSDEPRSPLARAGSISFLGCLKIFWAVSIFFWAGSRDFFGLFNIFLALLKRYFVAGSIFFELAQYFVWAASRYRVFFYRCALKMKVSDYM